jgi:hypothetical protein
MEDKKCQKCLWIAAYSNQSRTVSDTRGRQSVGWYVRQDGDAWVTNAVVSTIALPFWAYLMGAVAFAPYHDGNLAAILVMSFTVVSGLVAPRADKPKLREQPQEVATPERLPAVAAPERLPEVAATERPRLVDVLAG